MSLTRTGVMLCGHGSQDPEGIQEFNTVAHLLKDRLLEYEVQSGYLEFACPTIRDGLENLKKQGVGRIIAIPGMLFAAGHVKNDLPWEINSFSSENATLEVLYGCDLGIRPKLLQAAAERITSAEKKAGLHIPRVETLLLVVGRGTTDPDANSNIAKVSRMLGECLGFGWVETAYSGVTDPRVNQSLGRITALGFRRIIVFPYFLFTGVLVKRIYSQAEEIAAYYPKTEFIKASYLNNHPLVLESFTELIVEILQGNTAMNCQLCKYREQIVGYESDVGSIQTGHHHHVRGIHHPHTHLKQNNRPTPQHRHFRNDGLL